MVAKRLHGGEEHLRPDADEGGLNGRRRKNRGGIHDIKSETPGLRA